MKEKMVTRTITTVEATVLCLNTNTAEPFNVTITVPGKMKGIPSLEKVAHSKIDNEVSRAVAVVSYEEVETLYGMTEAEFINHSEKLPGRTKGTKETTNE